MGKTKPGRRQNSIERSGPAATKEAPVRLPARIMTTILPLTEASLEQQCTDLLAFDGWRSLKTDPVSRREWAKGFGELGMADHLYIRYSSSDDEVWLQTKALYDSTVIFARSRSQVMWIEWKRKGKSSTLKQREWHDAERARGALVVTAGEEPQDTFRPTFEAFCAWYRGSGLMRRPGLL